MGKNFLLCLKIVYYCSWIPTLQTSHCQGGFKSLSRWTDCCPVTTIGRAIWLLLSFLAVRKINLFQERRSHTASVTQYYSFLAFQAFILPSEALLFIEIYLIYLKSVLVSRPFFSPFFSLLCLFLYSVRESMQVFLLFLTGATVKREEENKQHSEAGFWRLITHVLQ